jgi:hypothetical protein
MNMKEVGSRAAVLNFPEGVFYRSSEGIKAVNFLFTARSPQSGGLSYKYVARHIFCIT